MLEKVKLTQEQSYAIDQLRTYDFEDVLIMRRRKDMPHVYSSLDSLTVNELGSIFFIPDSYEVEPEFKDDEWIVLNDGTVTQILYVKGYVFPHEFEKCFAHERGGDNWYDYKTIVRHATPEEIKAEEERRVWKSIGREVKGWKWGDVLILDVGTEFQVLSDRCEAYANAYYDSGQVRKIYPVESSISFEKGESHAY